MSQVILGFGDGDFGSNKPVIARSTDGGLSFTNPSIPPSMLVQDFFQDVFTDGAGNIVACGTSAIVSTDNGATWTSLLQDDSHGSPYLLAGGVSICCIFNNGRMLMTGSHYDNPSPDTSAWHSCIIYSDNLSTTTLVLLDPQNQVFNLAASSSTNVVAAASDGLWQSSNNGASWTQRFTAVGSQTFPVVVYNGSYFMAIDNGPTSPTSTAQCKTSPTGTTWTTTNSTMPFSMPGLGSNESLLIWDTVTSTWYGCNFGDHHVYASTDNGVTWPASYTSPSSSDSIGQVIRLGSYIFACGGTSTGSVVYRFDGSSWTRITQTLDGNGFHGMFGTDALLVAGTSGGNFYTSTDHANTWTVSTGYTIPSANNFSSFWSFGSPTPPPPSVAQPLIFINT